MLRLDFRLDVSGIVSGDFSFSPVLSDEGLSKLSDIFSNKVYELRTLALPWSPAAGRLADETLEALALEESMLTTPLQPPLVSLLV